MDFHVPFTTYAMRYETKLLALYHALRDSMVDGVLPWGTRLPSTRELAGLCGLSRGTVLQAYDMLAADGYVEGHPGRGTYVAYRSGEAAAGKGQGRGQAEDQGRGSLVLQKADSHAALDPQGKTHAAQGAAAPQYKLTAWGERLLELNFPSEPPVSLAPGRPDTSLVTSGPEGGLNAGRSDAERKFGRFNSERHSARPDADRIDFSVFRPDYEAFPQADWNRCLYEQVRQLSRAGTIGRACPPQGYEPLREGIARYLRRARGLAVEAAHIAVTAGSAQAIALLTQLLANPGEAAVAETPAYRGIRVALKAAGVRCIDAEVDKQGIVPADWSARMLFVTPTRQFPTGAVLSLERRQQLLRWSAERGAVIVEDDYDSEFRHRGRSLEPLKALDREQRVVYIGSFTKTLLPGIRIGYAVLPTPLVPAFVRAQRLYEPYPPNLLEQMALASFMASGEYERHLRRMKRIYGRKMQLLGELSATELGRWFDWIESDAGLHLFGWWRYGAEAYEAARRACEASGVVWAEAERAQDGRRGIYLHFSHLSEEELREGVQRLLRGLLEFQEANLL